MSVSISLLSLQELTQQLSVLTDENHSEKVTLDQIDLLVQSAQSLYQEGRLDGKDIKEFITLFSDQFLQETLQGYGLRKPYGYAGDFLMIDKIYTHWKSKDERFTPWDQYFHQQAAPMAVRNRKAYFKQELKAALSSQQPIRLLNVASGPARDLLELYELLDDPQGLKTVCVDLDEHAIAYAKERTIAFRGHIDFVHSNAFRFDTQQKFDVIWSAGLFDYLSDKAAILLLKKFKTWLEPGGKIIIGNFNELHNPSRTYMEVFGDWYLIHRTEQELLRLGELAGFNIDQMYVGQEEEGVNLFLHIDSK